MTRRAGRSRLARAAVGALLLCGAVLLACGSQWHGGVHAKFAWSAERGLRVFEVPEGPARAAGLREGDRIVAIEGVPVAGRPMAEVVAELRGEVGTRVHVTVERVGTLDDADAGAGAPEPVTEQLEIERAPYAGE